MEETTEITLAGQMMGLPMGGSVSLPYLPWSPNDVFDLSEVDRSQILDFIREYRRKIVKQVQG